jgi:thiol-disulfide isomerase/thioredoxin
VKARTRNQLLVIAGVAVFLVGGNWLYASLNDTGDDTTVTFEQPTIETNADVEGDPLPDSTVQSLQGDDVDIASLVGQPMVINIWGSTCGPCKKELPDFAAAHLQYAASVRFVGISYLPASDREERFARDRGVEYQLLYDGTGDFINDMGVAAFPVTLFVDATGRIVRQTGLLDEAQLIAYIEGDLL